MALPAGAAAILTLGEWGVLLLAMALSIFGFQRMSNRHWQLSKQKHSDATARTLVATLRVPSRPFPFPLQP